MNNLGILHNIVVKLMAGQEIQDPRNPENVAPKTDNTKTLKISLKSLQNGTKPPFHWLVGLVKLT